MTTHNANNERIKRQYFAYLKEAKRHSEPTVDAVAKALDRFETRADETLMIDDTQGNLDSAAEVGLGTVLFTSAAQLRDELVRLRLL